LLDKVKEDQTRARMKHRLDTMAVKTFYAQAKYDKAAEILKKCFGHQTGELVLTALSEKSTIA
jgi:hypothetical protein